MKSRSMSTDAHLLILSIFLFIRMFENHQVLSQDDGFSSESQSCISIFHTPGSCVSIKECDPILELIKKHPSLGRRIVARSLCPINENGLAVCCPGDDDSSESNEDNSDGVKPTENTGKPLSPPQCGYSNGLHDRVVGGNPASLGAWPWIALVGYGSPGSQHVDFRCGGTLISSRHVVTAAHCVHGLENDIRLVRLGEHNLDNPDDGAKPVDVNIEKAIVHPRFNAEILQNDIAILKLDQDVEFTDSIHPICLPVTEDLKNRNFVGYYPFVAGWGSTSYKGPPSSILQEAQVPVVETSKCKESYSAVRNLVVDDRDICAGYAQGGKDACQGDSGGPLMFPQKTTYYLIGVVSGGYKCAEPGYPGIYTRVTSFLDFILSNIN